MYIPASKAKLPTMQSFPVHIVADTYLEHQLQVVGWRPLRSTDRRAFTGFVIYALCGVYEYDMSGLCQRSSAYYAVPTNEEYDLAYEEATS